MIGWFRSKRGEEPATLMLSGAIRLVVKSSSLTGAADQHPPPGPQRG
jgi:hypothetical protein